MINFGLGRVNTSGCNALMNSSQCPSPIGNQQARWLTVLLSPSATSSAQLRNSDSRTSETDGVTSVGVVRTQCALLCGGFATHRRKCEKAPRDSPEYIQQDRRESHRVNTNKCSELWINLPTWRNWVFICVLSARHVSGLHAHLQEQWM
jgi:hypothetical protein